MFLQSNQDKALIKVCIKGLNSYITEYTVAKKCADPLKDHHFTEICDLVENLELYWGLSDRQDRRAKVEDKICKAQKNKIHSASTKIKIATINGLYRYAIEMVNMQGVDAKEEIKHVQDTMHVIADYWQLDINWVDDMCSKIDYNFALLGKDSGMTLQF